MKSATQEQADRFAEIMARKLSFTVIRKRSAFFSQWIAAGFDLARMFGAKVPSGADFLDRYATTIGPLVLMPDGMSPDVFIEVLTHEAEHVVQFFTLHPEKDLNLPGGTGMWWLYLTEPEARVQYEADPYSSQMELRVARGQPIPSPDEFTLPLEGGYALGPNEVRLAHEILERRATSVMHGTVTTPAGRAAIATLREIDPDLLAPTFR